MKIRVGKHIDRYTKNENQSRLTYWPVYKKWKSGQVNILTDT